MKTYQNEQLGFAIDIPEEWLRSPIPSEGLEDVVQLGCYDEAFNFVVGPLLPERLLERTELEFRLYAQSQGYTDLEFGRITVGGKEHIWARYRIQDKMGTRWNKKYMIVFGVTEFTITATCNDPKWFAQREKDWDAIVKSFRLTESREREICELEARRTRIAGPLYEKAYEAVSQGRYSDARVLLEKCLLEDPDHILAHKELAVVLRQLGDARGALGHRREVKRHDPSDTLNRLNISALLTVLGDNDEALREIDGLLEMEPNNREFQAFKASLMDNPLSLTYPQHYRQESEQVPGDRCHLGLVDSSVEDSPVLAFIRLVYQWDAMLSYEEAFRLDLRVRAYIACAIYDAATAAGLLCQAFGIPHGRRPSWLIEGGQTPISLINAASEFSDRTCLMEIGPLSRNVDTSQGGGALMAKLLTGFIIRFSDICV